MAANAAIITKLEKSEPCDMKILMISSDFSWIPRSCCSSACIDSGKTIASFQSFTMPRNGMTVNIAKIPNKDQPGMLLNPK